MVVMQSGSEDVDRMSVLVCVFVCVYTTVQESG